MNIFFTSHSVIEIKKHNASEYNILVKSEPGLMWRVLFSAKATFTVYRGSYYVFYDVATGLRTELDTEMWLEKCLDRHKFLEKEKVTE